ncbi:hypothetical protein AURANDRAFT_67831 [Aureococcus anophagefferens]|uniref:Uncharacterized protein n=1 Tax=Aureococcus anophagefferens TaxID=44056 RepID=F0YMJ7_AURAN|nr:hypothetical protein AURANDRAFT_67831 [Aureococcus anophagefferens]EGB03636.1 hypothetical protein AURANDRAFT_67831 [Aureococcus anophagefferens]|eukprot:XP_009041638.1 hypothetical protein AURANDRAFT_67831 [Aureococcus anophagefferens]
MVIGRRKIARGRPSGASSRDGGASSRRAAAGFPAISNNLLMERVEQHTVGVSGPRVRSTTSVGASLALGATASRYGGASSRRAAAGFPAIFNDLSAERVDQHTVGVCGARVRTWLCPNIVKLCPTRSTLTLGAEALGSESGRRVAERVATKTMSRETRTAPPSDHPTASIPRFSSIGGGLSEPVCGAATPLDVQSGSDALSRPITGAPLARASGERGTRQLQLGRLLPAPRKRHQHGLQRRRAHERGLALSLRRDILSRLQKTLGRRNGALRACFPAVGASPVHPSRTKPVQTRRIRPMIGCGSGAPDKRPSR